MNDGGAIRIEAGNSVYTAPGNKILNNKIHDVTDASIMDSNGYCGNGIYLDNQTGLVDVKNNLVYGVSANAMFTPQGPAAPNQASTVKNNIFAYARGAIVAINNPYTNGLPPAIPLVWNFTDNLIYFDRDNNSTPKFFVQGGCIYPGGVPYTVTLAFEDLCQRFDYFLSRLRQQGDQQKGSHHPGQNYTRDFFATTEPRIPQDWNTMGIAEEYR